jgi:sugar (pentulose or hexulose) kinase
MTEPYLLGIDIGTSAVKSVLFDVEGQEIAVSRRIPNIIRLQPGWSEVSMEALWQDVVATIREVAYRNDVKEGRILAIGLSGTACGAWLIDNIGRPVRNAIIWNDGRAADIIGQWQKSGALKEIFQISGNAMFPGYTLAVLRWLKTHEPQTLMQAKHLLFCKDWIRYKLTGKIATDPSDTSYMPFDIRKADYSEELLQICELRDTERLFPPIIGSDVVAGQLRSDLSKDLGIKAGTPVITGLVDVAAATLGAGAYMPGQACSIIGTSFLNNLITDEPTFQPEGIGVQAITVGDMWIRSMVNTSGTINLQWFLEEFLGAEKGGPSPEGEDVYRQAEEIAANVPIGSGGLIYHPYINTAGVISPFVNPAARAQFFGLSIEHTRAHMLRAVYEGTALSMLDCYRNMPADLRQICISGGGTRSAFWCQMFADCIGRKIVVPNGNEPGARGVALLAGIACGAYDSLRDAVDRGTHVDREINPDPDANKKYQAIYELYKKVYQHLNEDWWERHHLLATLSEG